MEQVLAAPAKPSKVKTIAYWVATGLIVFELLYGASWDFNWVNKDFVDGVMKHLGYPPYVQVLLGYAKIPAAIILLLPGLPILKEWAYAGVTFIFGGAVVSHIVAGDGFDVIVWPLVFCLLTLTSWWLRPANRRVAAVIAAG